MARRWTKLGAALVVSACSVALFGAPGAVAKETQCNTGLNSTLTGTHDNVVVPPGAFCSLGDLGDGTVVKGNVKALEDSSLFATNSTIGRNVVGDQAEVVQVVGNTIHGNVDVKKGEVDDGSVFTTDVALRGNIFTDGNVKIEKMTGGIAVSGNTGVGNIQVLENLIPVSGPVFNHLEVVANTIAGNLQVSKNRGTGSDKDVFRNAVGGNLQCFENDTPFTSLQNEVTGNAQGQCAQP